MKQGFGQKGERVIEPSDKLAGGLTVFWLLASIGTCILVIVKGVRKDWAPDFETLGDLFREILSSILQPSVIREITNGMSNAAQPIGIVISILGGLIIGVVLFFVGLTITWIPFTILEDEIKKKQNSKRESD
jgi:putative effector of murein hydrolase LrgA (UPF0299 family)